MSQVNLKNPFDRWMVARNVEYAESEGVDKVAARLRAQGYNRVADAVESIRKAASVLNDYFSVLIPNMSGDGKDWDEKEEGEIYGIFSGKLLTPREFALDIVQEI